MESQKILLVGEPRICPQVAYVMDWQDFEQVEQLTDAEKYHNYKIVVCAFKKKSKKLIKVKNKALNIIYLDDICRELDKDYSFTAHVASFEPKTTGKKIVKKVITVRGVMSLLQSMRQRIAFRKQFWLKRIPPRLMKPSELLLRVLYAKPTNVFCDHLGTTAFVAVNGQLYGCCYPGAIIPYGSVTDLANDNVFNNVRARIIKLSSLNHSFCFCNLQKCDHHQFIPGEAKTPRYVQSADYPEWLNLATDETCNLCCPSCRNVNVSHNQQTNSRIVSIHEALLQSGWLDKVKKLSLAGLGEVFFSPNYQQLLANNFNCRELNIVSNGILFDESHWNLFKDKDNSITVIISVDAATAETYRKLRGGDFGKLLYNLEFISNLRKAGRISFFQLNFVVQRDNYQEMVDFVNLALRLNVDLIHFIPLANWGTFSKKEFKRRSLIIGHKYLKRDFYTLLQNPIFRVANLVIDLENFQPYLAASAKRYGE